jgi:hypothetical protein
VDTLPDAPPQLDDGIEEDLLPPAALPWGGADSVRKAAIDGTTG